MKVEYRGTAWLTLTMIIAWIAGIVLAHGFWSTAAAVTLPPYAWYLFIERIMRIIGLVP